MKLLRKRKFPDNLKLAHVTPVFKKEDRNLVRNNRSAKVLLVISNIKKKKIQKQIVSHIEKYLPPYLCGDRKSYCTQQALILISIIGKWSKIIDKNGYAGAILMDLNKAFDAINHQLIIAKLHAYRFSKDVFLVVSNYLFHRKQSVKINSFFSSWPELIQGVPQASVIGTLF